MNTFDLWFTRATQLTVMVTSCLIVTRAPDEPGVGWFVAGLVVAWWTRAGGPRGEVGNKSEL